MKNRDEFLAKTKETLAKRAHYICSQPNCLSMTIGPHSNPDKSLSTGIAAHIHAAAKGGPRYNPNQSSTERKSIKNALWLCHSCSDEIDKDEKQYPANLLFEWKRLHEKLIKNLRAGGKSSTLELLKPSMHNLNTAKKLIHIFEDSRVLYNLYDLEQPYHSLLSIKEIRKTLRKEKINLSEKSYLFNKINAMLKSCRSFMDEMKDIDLEKLRWNPEDKDWLQFKDTLAEMRKIFGIQLKEISKEYQIQVDEDLMSIFPKTKK
jgi:hypothetical protein